MLLRTTLFLPYKKYVLRHTTRAIIKSSSFIAKPVTFFIECGKYQTDPLPGSSKLPNNGLVELG